MNDFLIKHQQQPCATSCFSTCIAMIIGLPAEEVVNEIHDLYREGGIELGEVLSNYSVPFVDFRTAYSRHVDGSGVWVLGVPSLNIVGGMHQVLLEMLTDGTWAIFDPNEGKEGKKFYAATADHPSDLAVQFTDGYTVEAFISRENLEYYRAIELAINEEQP